MSNDSSDKSANRPEGDPEEMLRELLSTESGESTIPLAKHKRYSKRAVRMRKSVAPPPAGEWTGDEPTQSHLQIPREKIESMRTIDLKAERALRASQRPVAPPPPQPKPGSKK